MTAAVPTPDLQRIVEALKACRERYVITDGIGGPWKVREAAHSRMQRQDPLFSGSLDACLAYIDGRCAEAMLRAILPAELAALSRKIAPRDCHAVIEEDGEAEDHVWTLSTDSTRTGWNTDGGYPGYGMAKADADFAAAAWNLVRSLSAILGETQP